MAVDIAQLLAFAVKNRASDLHLSAGVPPMIRVDGDMKRINMPPLTHKEVHSMVYDIMNDKQRKAYAGSTRFYDIQTYHRTLQLGYTWYGKDFQGTGLNRHCKFLLLDFAFRELGMERVEFRADARNARSIAAMKAIGCTKEGILRSNQLRSDGARRDSIVLSILKREWDESLRSRLYAALT